MSAAILPFQEPFHDSRSNRRVRFAGRHVCAGGGQAVRGLKAEIEAKIQAQGVASYTLEIVPNSEVQDPNMVVGTCDGGTKKIIYQKNDR